MSPSTYGMYRFQHLLIAILLVLFFLSVGIVASIVCALYMVLPCDQLGFDEVKIITKEKREGALSTAVC